jgi:hypothetical protein
LASSRTRTERWSIRLASTRKRTDHRADQLYILV